MRKSSIAVAVFLLILGTMALPATADPAGFDVTDLTDPALDASDLAESLLTQQADDVDIVDDSVEFIGNPLGAGTFLGGSEVIGFSDGIILSSGQAADVVGPNDLAGTTTNLQVPGDQQLSDLVDGRTTYDASIVEFDFTVPEGAEEVFFTYVFGSEEYNFYVGSPYNDVFAFWVNGVNCAVVGDANDPVSINTINAGNSSRSFAPVNPELYINNDPFSGGLATPPLVPGDTLYNTEMNGFTVPLTCQAAVDDQTVNTMRLAIADTSDAILDSWVLIQAGSLSITPPEPVVPDEFSVSLEGFSATYEQGASGTGDELAQFSYVENAGNIGQVFNVFTIDGFTTLEQYQALFEDLTYDDYIRGLQGTSPDNVVAPTTVDVPIGFTLQDDAPIGDYTLRLTSYDVTGEDPMSVSLEAALTGDYAELDADNIDAAVVTLAVKNPAAPSIAARLLRDADTDNRYGQGRSGGNHIANVAQKMTEDHATDFNGVPKTDALAYECEVAKFLSAGEVGPAADVSTAACGDDS